MELLRKPPRIAWSSDWQWEDEDQTRELVDRLRKNEVNAVETRSFLRPIFKWMKNGVRKNGQKHDESIEKSFALVDWMVQISQYGDTTRGIMVYRQLQPNYALNTILTTSQRAGCLSEAIRAFELIAYYGYEPDVFTYTALIDVTARNGDVLGAIQRYEDMRLTSSRPNIVTFTTIIRAIGIVKTKEVTAMECLRFLEHAREEETFDESLYLDALDVCVHRQDQNAATQVLKEISIYSTSLRDTERFMIMLKRVIEKCPIDESTQQAWLVDGLLTEYEWNASRANNNGTVSIGTRYEAPTSLGCLGHQTSDSVREAVVRHDINRLIERLVNGGVASTNDFETLIHQCRKRKWKDEIHVIVDAMNALASTGWTTPYLPPQPQLVLSIKTYVAIIEAYLTCGEESLAWKTFCNVPHKEQVLYRKYIRGCYLLTDCTHMMNVLTMAKADPIHFTHRMCIEIARMHGIQHDQGLDIVLNQFPSSIPHEKRQEYLEELVLSCAYKHNTKGLDETMTAMKHYGFSRSATTEMAVLICCLQHSTFTHANEMLCAFQDKERILHIPLYESLLREMYFKYTLRTQSFDDSSRATAIKTLQLRRSLFEHAYRERVDLEQAKELSTRNQIENREYHAFIFWCELSHLECAPLLFTQHFVEGLTTIRDKHTKFIFQHGIRKALHSTSDPVLFTLRAVISLRWLDIPYRSQGKLAKQMLLLLDEDLIIESQHRQYCISQLSHMTIHIVKELDEVMLLHHYDPNQLVAFCLQSLETDNVDKMIGFVVGKETLYTVENVMLFTPKLVDLYVLHAAMNVLQFYKTDVEYAVTMQHLFVREVIELERLNAMGREEEDLPLARRAITEFKLEHEAEFMPLVLYKPRVITASSPVLNHVWDPTKTYLKLPLPSTHVIVVDQDESLTLAYDVLLHPDIQIIGLDAEWRPDRGQGYGPSRCSVLQIACNSHAFVFDLLEIAMSDLEELLTTLLTSSTILKVGFALDGDLKRLQWSFPNVKCFDRIINMLDFAYDVWPQADTSIKRNKMEMSREVNRRRHRGLSALVQDHLGTPLDKRQQKSDWEQRPLTSDQIRYAALDAYCLLMLYNTTKV